MCPNNSSFFTFTNQCFSTSFRLLLTSALIFASVTFSFAVAIPGTNTGPIPEAPTLFTCGTPRDVLFNVTGQTAPLGSLSVNFTMSHDWIGDLQIQLIAPNATTHLIFSYVGRQLPAADFGDNSDLEGTYGFADSATLNIWTAATGGADLYVIPPGSYRTQAAGPNGTDTPGPAFTSINTAFAGVTAPNGTWTLRFLDCQDANAGTVSAATLNIVGPSAAGASIRGRVETKAGVGIQNAIISVSGGNLESPRIVTSNPFGYFSINDLPAGQTYILTARSKRYFISNAVQAVSLFDDLTDLIFVAEPF